MAKVAHEIPNRSAGSKRTYIIDYTERLRGDDLLSGTPTLAEVTSTDLTISGGRVNVAAETFTLNRQTVTVAIGKGVLFEVSAGTAGARYAINVEINTDNVEEYDDDFEHNVI
jgi:hypothetical protein